MTSNSNIHALKKIDEANFFLEKLKTTTDTEWEYYFSAFVSAWRSILDILLYDAAEVFNLGFSRNEKMKLEDFIGASKDHGNETALKFRVWWSRKLTDLTQKPLYKNRTFLVHRGYLDLGEPKIITIPAFTTGLFTAYGIDFQQEIGYATTRVLYRIDIVVECAQQLTEMREFVYESIAIFFS